MKDIRLEEMNAAIEEALGEAGLTVLDEEAKPDFIVIWEAQRYGVWEVGTRGSQEGELRPLPMTLVNVVVEMGRPVVRCQLEEAERLLEEVTLPSILMEEQFAVVEGRVTEMCLSRIAREAVPDFHDVVHEPEEPCREEDFPCM